MAIVPLFIDSIATLKAKLRLSGSAQTDAEAILESVIEQVRVNFFDRLGVVRVQQLLALSYIENAVTADGVLRAKCNAVELSWVMALLYRRLPVLFMDGSGDKQEQWNADGFSRYAQPSELQKEIDRLMADVEMGLSSLTSGEPNTTIGEGVSADSIEPICPVREYPRDINLSLPRTDFSLGIVV